MKVKWLRGVELMRRFEFLWLKIASKLMVFSLFSRNFREMTPKGDQSWKFVKFVKSGKLPNNWEISRKNRETSLSYSCHVYKIPLFHSQKNLKQISKIHQNNKTDKKAFFILWICEFETYMKRIASNWLVVIFKTRDGWNK